MTAEEMDVRNMAPDEMREFMSSVDPRKHQQSEETRLKVLTSHLAEESRKAGAKQRARQAILPGKAMFHSDFHQVLAMPTRKPSQKDDTQKP
jgi:hypothetical protein